MFFCPKCGNVLFPKKGERRIKLSCSCGYESRDKEAIIKESIKIKKGVEVAKKKVPLPKTKAKCEKCGNKEAFYWLAQTRSSDEAETRFFECTKCGYRWRDYK